MIIPKEYGGLGFSPYAHSEVVRKISTRSVTAAVTVMVPNSLGPGELLMRFGTRDQQQQWLPRLADGREIPCFGLTSPEAGSDAASMVDSGVICKGNFEGREVLGLRLNWHKRYITLGPVATLLGLAFKAYDPDHLVGHDGRPRHHRGADPDPSARRRDRPPPFAGECRCSRTARTGAAMSLSRWTTSSAAEHASARAGRC
jgi:alkylation response protein AidB-like acyl-CoA dehydrogenase